MMGNIEGIQKMKNCTCPTTVRSTASEITSTNRPLESVTDVTMSSILPTAVTDFSGSITTFSLSNANTVTNSHIVEVFQSHEMDEQSLNEYLSTHFFRSFSFPVTIFSAMITSSTNGLSVEDEFMQSTTAEQCTCLDVVDDVWLIHRYITALSFLIVCSVIILANFFVIGNIVWSLHQHYARKITTRSKRSYIFMLNLALADLFVSRFENLISCYYQRRN